MTTLYEMMGISFGQWRCPNCKTTNEISDEKEILTMLEKVIKYFDFRKYVWPDATQALMFLISEVGELIEAYIAVNSPGDDTRAYLELVVATCKMGDIMVSGQDKWVRNNDRIKTASIPDEIGDVNMMLRVFAKTLNRDIDEDLLAKMHKKGFEC